MADSFLSSLTTADGTGIRTDRLAAVVTGLIASAFGTGLADLVSGVLNAFVVGPLEGLARFYDQYIMALFGGVGRVGLGVWEPLIGLVRSLGPVAFPAAVLVVIVLAYLVRTGWSLRG